MSGEVGGKTVNDKLPVNVDFKVRPPLVDVTEAFTFPFQVYAAVPACPPGIALGFLEVAVR